MNFSSFNSDSSNLQTQEPTQQTQEPTQQTQEPTQQTQQPTKTKKPFTIHDFLVSKTGTIITTAFGMAIGFAFKEFISSIVVNLFKPLIAFIFTMTHLNNYYDFNSVISPENNAINFSSFITSFLSFILVVISVYSIGLNYQ